MTRGSVPVGLVPPPGNKSQHRWWVLTHSPSVWAHCGTVLRGGLFRCFKLEGIQTIPLFVKSGDRRTHSRFQGLWEKQTQLYHSVPISELGSFSQHISDFYVFFIHSVHNRRSLWSLPVWMHHPQWHCLFSGPEMALARSWLFLFTGYVTRPQPSLKLWQVSLSLK